MTAIILAAAVVRSADVAVENGELLIIRLGTAGDWNAASGALSISCSSGDTTGDTTGDTAGDTAGDMTETTTTIIIAAAASAGGLLLLGLGVACGVCIARRSRKNKQGTSTTAASSREMQTTRDYDVFDSARASMRNASTTTSSDYGSWSPSPTPGTSDKVRVVDIALSDVKLGEQLGEGAFGVVYKGTWKKIDVAVKQVKASMLGGAADFHGEIKKMAALPYHENVVQLHGATTLKGGDPAAVVEFCAGGALAALLYGEKKRRWRSGDLISVAHGAASGLAHLHEHGIVHRDVAARNVLLTTSGRDAVAKLGDFGMARELDDGNEEQNTVRHVGPVAWMAPEQLESRKYSTASDVFAFGVLLYEIFKREAPWRGLSLPAIGKKVMDGERLDVTSRKIPKAAAALMKECWKQKSKERPSMARVRSDIEDFVGSDSESQS
jgi:hypothetical protein